MSEKIPLRVKYREKYSDIPLPFEEGTLYFIKSQNTIWKDGDKPFSGITNVTITNDDDKTTLSFSTQNDNSGNAGIIVLPSINLVQRVQNLEEQYDDLNMKTSVVFNLDDMEPSGTPYTLESAVQYVNTIDGNFTKINAIIIFNDGTRSRIYVYKSLDVSGFDNVDNWEEVTKGDSVQYYSSVLMFPKTGEEGVVYIDTTNHNTYYWDSTNIKYIICGFNPSDIEYINANF